MKNKFRRQTKIVKNGHLTPKRATQSQKTTYEKKSRLDIEHDHQKYTGKSLFRQNSLLSRGQSMNKK